MAKLSDIDTKLVGESLGYLRRQHPKKKNGLRRLRGTSEPCSSSSFTRACQMLASTVGSRQQTLKSCGNIAEESLMSLSNSDGINDLIPKYC